MYCHAAPVLRVKEALKNLGIVTLTGAVLRAPVSAPSLVLTA